YAPAPDNPFIDDDDASPDVYAYGIRSPWRSILDRRGRPWFGDVGSVLVEEINVVTEPGQNFGWANGEGVCDGDCAGLTDPIAFWDRDPDHDYLVEDPEAPALPVRVAVVGTAYDPGVNDRYAGAMDDQVLFTDACVGFVRAIEFTDHVVSDVPVGHLRTAAAMHQAADGYIYALTFGRCQTDNPIDLDNEGGLFRAVLDTSE
ncbi:MAG TPA: PQQ-dependent sugar dehydrogenase, partial [Polyangiaceae bacterium]